MPTAQLRGIRLTLLKLEARYKGTYMDTTLTSQKSEIMGMCSNYKLQQHNYCKQLAAEVSLNYRTAILKKRLSFERKHL